VETEMLTADESAALLEVEIRLIEDFILDGKIHAIRTASGNLRVCKDSLFRTDR
jgi:predicted site-specific integrase-resolvase